MNEIKRWISIDEARHDLADISRSTLYRRIKELKLEEQGYVLRLGRRLLFSSSLIGDLPNLVLSNTTKNQEAANG